MRGGSPRGPRARGGSGGRGPGPARSPPALPRGCSHPCRRVRGCGGGCPAPTRRPHVWRGPGCIPPRPHEKSAARRAQLCLGCGALGGPSPLPPPRFLSLPFASRQARATRSTPGGSPQPREALGTRVAEVGVFRQPGRVKFEDRLRAKPLRRLSRQLVWSGGSSCLSHLLGCQKLR